MSLRIAAATAALVLATSTFALAAGPVKFTLHPQNHSGETGYVTMTQDGDNVVVAVTTTNAPDATAQPIHIHKGTCDTLDPKPTYPLTTLQGGTSTTTKHPQSEIAVTASAGRSMTGRSCSRASGGKSCARSPR